MSTVQTRESIIVGLVAIAYSLSLAYIGGPTNPELILAAFLLVGACCYKFLPALSGRRMMWGTSHTVAAAYLVWLVVLTYTSTLPSNSIHFAWLLATFPLVVFLTADLDARSWFRAVILCAITGGVSAVWGIAEFLVSGKRANGPIIDPSSWCAIMNLFFFAMLYLLLVARERRLRAVGLIGVAVFSVAVFAAYSRVGTLVVVASVAFVVVTCARQGNLRSRLAVVVLVMVVCYGLVHARAGTVEASNDKEGYTLNFEDVGWSQRVALWRAGWQIYLDHPLVGSGPGTFKVQYPRYRTHGDLHNLGNFVHNDYLEYLLEGGPLLLAFLLSLVGLLGVRLVPSTVRVLKGDAGEVGPVLLTVAVGTLLVESLMSFPAYQMQTQMMAGLLFARYLKEGRLLRPVQLSVASPRMLQAGIVAGVLVLCSVPVLDAISSELVVGGRSIPLVWRLGDKASTFVETMRVLSVLRSQNPDNRFEMATIYRTSFDMQSDPAAKRSLAIAAALEYKAGLELNPWHEKARRYFAEFLEQNPWLSALDEIDSTPEALYREGIALTPVYIEPYLDLAAYLRRAGHADEAYELLSGRALSWADLHYGDFFSARIELFETLLPEAKRRGDRATLRRMLESMVP